MAWSGKSFIVYDERAILGDEDEAMVLSTSDTLEEARKDARSFKVWCAIYEYEVVDGQAPPGRKVEVWNDKGQLQ